jgi:hypothetical protein
VTSCAAAPRSPQPRPWEPPAGWPRCQARHAPWSRGGCVSMSEHPPSRAGGATWPPSPAAPPAPIRRGQPGLPHFTIRTFPSIRPPAPSPARRRNQQSALGRLIVAPQTLDRGAGVQCIDHSLLPAYSRSDRLRQRPDSRHSDRSGPRHSLFFFITNSAFSRRADAGSSRHRISCAPAPGRPAGAFGNLRDFN